MCSQKKKNKLDFIQKTINRKAHATQSRNSDHKHNQLEWIQMLKQQQNDRQTNFRFYAINF